MNDVDSNSFVMPILSANIDGMFDSFRHPAQRRAVTFDEVTLEDRPSDVLPNSVDFGTHVTRRLRLRIPVLSAAMDTVTEREMALAMAKVGGVGVLHRNMSVDEQVDALVWVRRKIHSGGMIDRPTCFFADDRISHLQHIVAESGFTFSSFPIVSRDDPPRLLGLVTRDELDFAEGRNLELGQIMKRRDQVVTANGLDVDSAQAYAIMKQRLVKKLPVVDPHTDQLLGMYVWRDVANNQRQVSSFSLDDNGNFLVAAAVGCGDAELERARALVQAGARIIVIDSSHGACQDARQLLRALKREFRDAPLQVIVGNIASYASAQFLLERDPSAADAREADLLLPDALKVGIGPGSICTTRRVTGTGVPQLTAVYEVVRAVRESGIAVPVIADGGVRSSGDVCKALAVGAAAVMLGNMLAGTKESAGRLVKRGKKSYKMYRGMGSLSAMAERAGSRLRYNALTEAGGDPAMLSERLTVDERTKVVAEGVEGLVEVTSDLPAVIQVLVGGIAGGFAHSGARTLAQFRERATFWTQSNIGAQEGKVHDVLQVTE